MFFPQCCQYDLFEECLNIKSVGHVNQPTVTQWTCRKAASDLILRITLFTWKKIVFYLLIFCCRVYAPIELCRCNTCMRAEFCLSFLCMLSRSQKSLIRVSFRPTLSDQLIREEAVRRLCRAAATGAEIQVRNAKN